VLTEAQFALFPQIRAEPVQLKGVCVCVSGFVCFIAVSGPYKERLHP